MAVRSGGDEGRSQRRVLGSLSCSLRKWMFGVVSVGQIPSHMAFIMDGNRRYAKKWQLEEGIGYKAGFLAVLSMIKYCYELGVRYITVYAFSIDNLRRRPQEVQFVMELMHEKIKGLLMEQSIVNKYGVRVFFVGNLTLLNDPIRAAAEQVMAATANNTNTVLFICVTYSSSDEILHSVQESCKQKLLLTPNIHRPAAHDDDDDDGDNMSIKLVDLEKNMYMRFAPHPDILIRTSGETRLSNFLLWQTTNCLLYCPTALWPDIGLKHLIWAVLKFQRNRSYLEKTKKLS